MQKREIKSFFGAIILLALLTTTIVATAIVTGNKKAEEKSYKVELPLSEWVKHDRGMEYIKSAIRLSDLPSKQTSFIIDSILTPFQSAIGNQINPILQQEQKVKDSLNKKPPPKN